MRFCTEPISDAEYKDDSTIIPRSSSVIVKRMPAARAGKGKASMYVSGVTPALPTSEAVQRPGASSSMTWHKGSMSKRFDGKEETPTLSTSTNPANKSSTPVRISLSSSS